MASSAPSAEFLRAESELAIQEARNVKAERNKDVGDPINLHGVPIDIAVRGEYIWIAENTTVARKVDLETGKSVRVFRGHTAPVSCLALCDRIPASKNEGVLITGSWDQHIKIWDVETAAVLSSTHAHTDFVKVLLFIPELNILVSGSSDKTVRIWDLSTHTTSSPLTCFGSISAHTRPVGALGAYIRPSSSPSASPIAVLFTADTMGVIKVWELERDVGSDGKPSIRPRPAGDDLKYHRTGVNQVVYGDGHVWTASTDETVQIHPFPPPSPTSNSKTRKAKAIPPITNPDAAFHALLPLPLHPSLTSSSRASSLPYLIAACDDNIRTYDISSLPLPSLLSDGDEDGHEGRAGGGSIVQDAGQAEFIRETEGHWHDVTGLGVWLRERKTGDGDGRGGGKEVWVVSASVDRTIRRWRLADLVAPVRPSAAQETTAAPLPQPKPDAAKSGDSGLTEEEERELAELMDED